MNDLAQARGMDVVFTQCAEFMSDFHSPTDPALAGAWNVDEEYVDWQWWLAREEGGEWQLMTWGY
jgi:D-alanyl-D-alanine carboxypeptidase